jgi:hypothetical protein
MNDEKSFPVLSVLYYFFAIPYNFFLGFIVGVAAPVAAIAAMVFGVRFLTNRMPFLSLQQGEDEQERRVTLELVPMDEVGTRFEVEKQKVTGELSSLQAEIKALIEEAKAEGVEVEEIEISIEE